jgi:DNA-binding transcriptional MerR regulator
MVTIAQIRDFVAREYTQASAEVQNFINWLEQKDAQIASAKALLEANGYTVTPK